MKVQMKEPNESVSSTLVMMPRLAPCSSSAAATSLCPSRAARCSGVYPEPVVASGHAPFASSCWTMSCLPRRLEMCSGVWSSWRQTANAAQWVETTQLKRECVWTRQDAAHAHKCCALPQSHTVLALAFRTTLALASTRAPFWMRYRTTLDCPALAAMWSAVSPL